MCMRVIACNSAYGEGGVGQHLAQLVEESRTAGRLRAYYAPGRKRGDARGRTVSSPQWQDWLLQYTPVRFSPGWRSYIESELFDRRIARILRRDDRAGPPRFMGFVGCSLQSFRQARRCGTSQIELVAANSHVRNLRAKHNRARERHGIGDSWLNGPLFRKTLREYEAADRIYVHSEYTRKSFLAAGFSDSELERTYLHVHPRFRPPKRRPQDDTFRVVYVGRVEATKGIPVLLQAFSKLSVPKKELILVGGWSTRRMRRYIEPWLDAEPIRLAPGDPRPVLHRADVFVHPSYEDGFGYAPMEALACGVPVIATADTGMKEYIQNGMNGFVVPTGRWEPILKRLEHLRHHPLVSGCSLLPPHYEEERCWETAQALTSLEFAS